MDAQSDIRPERAFTPVAEDRLRRVLAQYDVTEGVAVVGIRGEINHFQAAEHTANLIGVYDDVLCIVTPTAVHTFLGNTDPTRTIKDRAILQDGHRYRYMRGTHGITREKAKRYQAWVQAGPVIIRRFKEDGGLTEEIKGQWIGCNIHKGSWTTTGSAACQTIVPEKWEEFDGTLLQALKAVAQDKFWYVLIHA